MPKSRIIFKLNSSFEKLPIFFVVLFLVLTSGADAGDLQIMKTRQVDVLFDASLRQAAKEVVNLYPEIKEHIETVFKWELNLKPAVFLVKTREHFLKMANNPLVVAFAVPERNLIVIDYSKMVQNPFSLETTLKHELSHLLLHQHIKGEILPRWLDEGLCQWTSDGIAEVITDPKQSFLNGAALAKKLVRFRDLQQRFPHDKRSHLLAYEESKSFIVYIVGQFGNQGIINVLNHMKKGETIEVAVQQAFSVPFETLENKWQNSVRKKMTWFTFLSYHLYEILFTLMAIITVFAFIRLCIKKKDYEDNEIDDSASNGTIQY